MITLTGTRPLLKVSVRQDVRNIAPWVGLISVLSASSILAYAWIFPSMHDRQGLASTLGANPALSLVFGPARDLLTADGFNAWRAGGLGTLFAGLMATLIVVRNSRANEDSGQAELTASGVLARQSRLAVAVFMAAIASIALGLVSFTITVACGGGAVSTLVLAATFTASGLMFTGVAAVTAQIGSDARTATSIAVATLGICYVVRGYLDSSGAPGWTDWLTPFGWLQRARPATGNNPVPLLAALALTTVLVAGAFAVQNRRDFGLGLIPPRRGRADGRIRNVWAFAGRLHRGALLSWLIGLTGLGLVFGNLATSIGDVIANNPATAKILASGPAGSTNLTFAFIVTILQITGIIAAVMGVQMILRVYSEEVDHRVEPLLATSLTRSAYLASNALVAFAGPALAMLLAGTGVGVVAARSGHAVRTRDVIAQAAATIPAVWVLIALAAAAVGAAPTRRLIAWLGIVATFALTLLGPTFKLPGWALSISPLRHIPTVTAAALGWGGLAALGAVTVALLAVGFTGYRRRDII